MNRTACLGVFQRLDPGSGNATCPREVAMDTARFRIRTLGSFSVRYTLTLGLYWPWLLYSWASDLYRASGGRQYRPLLVIGTSVLTLGVGALYWHWRIARELVWIGIQRGVRVDPNLPTHVVIGSVLSVVVSVFSGGLAAVLGLLFAAGACWLTQNAFNQLAIEAPVGDTPVTS